MYIRCFRRLYEGGIQGRNRISSTTPIASYYYNRSIARGIFGLGGKRTSGISSTLNPTENANTAYGRDPGSPQSDVDFEERVARLVTEAVAERLKSGYFHREQRSSSLFMVLVVLGVCTLTVIYMENLRSSLIEATGSAAGSLLQSKTFRSISLSYLKSITEEFLQSPDVHKIVKEELIKVLKDSEDVLREQVTNILQADDVVQKSYDISQSIANKLCEDPAVIESVGQLLLDAINTETAVNGAAQWVVDLTKRDDTCSAFESLISERVLSDAKVQVEALNFFKAVTNRYLTDKEIMQASVTFIKALMDRPALQSHLSQTLLSIVKQSIYPRWLFPESQAFARYRHDIHGAGENHAEGARHGRFI